MNESIYQTIVGGLLGIVGILILAYLKKSSKVCGFSKDDHERILKLSEQHDVRDQDGKLLWYSKSRSVEENQKEQLKILAQIASALNRCVSMLKALSVMKKD